MYFYNQTPIRLIELFAGIGSQAKALTNLGLNFEHYRVCEFDEHAVRSYNAVHGTNFVTSDITKISASDLGITNTDEFTYLLTYSFPCQDLSNAGKGAGMEKGSGTRSGLLWEVERLLNECDELPQVLLMENVPQVHGKKNIEHFNKWIAFLESKDYSNHWKDLNAKDYDIPQSRNRCYMVSILGDYSYDFPEPMSLTLKLKDLLDDVVDERYYLSDRQIDKMKNNTYVSASYSRRVTDENGIMSTLCARDYKDPKCVEIKEPSPTCNVENMAVCVPQALVVSEPKIEVVGNYSPSGHEASMIVSPNGLAPTIKENHGTVTATVEPQSSRVRKLTPKECWRLMGFTDEDFLNAEKVCSNSQLYKQAGNSIVVNVLMAIFKELFVPKKTRSEWLDELLGGGL